MANSAKILQGIQGAGSGRINQVSGGNKTTKSAISQVSGPQAQAGSSDSSDADPNFPFSQVDIGTSQGKQENFATSTSNSDSQTNANLSSSLSGVFKDASPVNGRADLMRPENSALLEGTMASALNPQSELNALQQGRLNESFNSYNHQGIDDAWGGAGGNLPPANNNSWGQNFYNWWNGNNSNHDNSSGGGYSKGPITGGTSKPSLSPREALFQEIEHALKRTPDGHVKYRHHGSGDSKHLDITLTGIDDPAKLTAIIDKAIKAGFNVEDGMDEDGNTVYHLSGDGTAHEVETFEHHVDEIEAQTEEERKIEAAETKFEDTVEAAQETLEELVEVVDEVTTVTDPKTGEERNMTGREIAQAVLPPSLVAAGDALAEAARALSSDGAANSDQETQVAEDSPQNTEAQVSKAEPEPPPPEPETTSDPEES